VNARQSRGFLRQSINVVGVIVLTFLIVRPQHNPRFLFRSTMVKPAFVFVPGASQTTEYWNKVIGGLAKHGYSGAAVPLPSVLIDGNPPTFDFSEDVAAIRDAVSKLVEEQGKDVVVVLHSYGGFPGSEALKGLGKREREEKGLQNGVMRMVFIMALASPENVQLAGERGDISKFMPYQKIDLEVGTSVVLPEDAKGVFFNDLPNAEASEWATKQQPQSIGVFWSKITYAAWRYIPSTYVICEQDQALPVPMVEMMLQNLKGIEPSSFDTVERVVAGHFPMLSQVEEILRILRKAAGETVKAANIVAAT
jgi:pimeloyl-ACP methyl ester carboxylesterase